MENGTVFDNVPKFGIGEIDGVQEYLEVAFKGMCDRFAISKAESKRLLDLAFQSLYSAITMLPKMNNGLVESTMAAREFWFNIGEIMVNLESHIHNAQNMAITLQAAKQQGRNVLIVQNHRSGADTMVMEILLRRTFGKGVTDDWTYLSGHAVNLYVLPLMFTLALQRVQIFSAKYRSSGLDGGTDATMARQNVRAMLALKTLCSKGGKIVTLYPEGGRGENGMILGEPKTICVPQTMHRASDAGLLILPTYVHGATNILPVHRGENEFNEMFVNAHQGTSDFIVGQPILWEEIQPRQSVIEELAATYEGNSEMSESVAYKAAYQRLMVDTLLGMVAELAPNDLERGVYNDSQYKSLVNDFRLRREIYAGS